MLVCLKYCDFYETTVIQHLCIIFIVIDHPFNEGDKTNDLLLNCNIELLEVCSLNPEHVL